MQYNVQYHCMMLVASTIQPVKGLSLPRRKAQAAVFTLVRDEWEVRPTRSAEVSLPVAVWTKRDCVLDRVITAISQRDAVMDFKIGGVV